MALPDSLRIELVQLSAGSSGPPEDKVADWSGAIQQLRQIAQWIVGAVIAWVVTIFATTAFARLGLMSWDQDSARLLASGLSLLCAISAVSVIFYFGVRVIAPSGTSLDELATATDRTSTKARRFLFNLNNLGDRSDQLRKILDTEDERWEPWIRQLRQTLGFAVVKTRFDELKVALVLALLVAIPASLAFVWAANPPEGYHTPPTEEVTIDYDESGNRIGHKVTVHRPKSDRQVPELP